MSKILANQIANYGDDAPIEIKEGLNIPTGKPIQAAGSAGTNGQVLTSTGTSIQWTTPFNGDYNALANLPTIPAAQVASDWNATSGVSRILNKPVVPAQPSVVTNAAGIPSLTYNSGNGQFTYTPPDLASYAQTANLNTANWDAAFGWGDHASAGYLTAEADTLNTVTGRGSTTTNNITVGRLTAGGLTYPTSNGTLGQILTSDGAGNVVWGASSGGAGIALTDLSVSTAAAGNAALTYNNLTGVFTYTPPNLSGYLTSYTETDPVFSISPAAGITSGKITNWDTAYAWGDHTAAGYLTAEADTLATVVARGNTTGGSITFGELERLNFFTTNTRIYGDASGLNILASGNNDITISSNASGGSSGDVIINTVEGGYLIAKGADGIELHHNGTTDKKFETTSTGVTITGDLNFTGDLYQNGVLFSGGGGANVTISDTAPGSPTAGDLWWESDRGRLKIYYQDVDSQQWVDASPPLAQPNVPVAAGFITLNGTSPTWTGTTGYTVTGTQPGGAGTDYVITLTFPTAYSARTDYIVQATYDGTNYIGANGAEIAVARGTSSVVFTPRRLDSNPLSLGEIMVTITNL